MPKQIIESLPAEESYPGRPEHASKFDTFGRGAVTLEERITADTLMSDYLGRQLSYGDYLEANFQTSNDVVQRELGGLATKTLSSDEQQQLEQHRRNRYQISSEISGAQNYIEEDQNAKKRSLMALRDRLGTLSPEQRQAFNYYVATSASRFIHQVKIDWTMKMQDEMREGKAPAESLPNKLGPSWHQWFSEIATDDQLLNFLQWHVDTLDHQQSSPETRDMIDRQRGIFQKGVADGVAAGWLHPEARSAQVEVKKVIVLIGDEFDTIMQERGGYHEWDSREVVIAQGSGYSRDHRTTDLQTSMQHALKHEWNHAVLSGRNYDRWYEEAMTEHCAEVYDDGMPDVFNPHKRPDKGVYIEERSLVDVMANFGDTKVPARLFTRYYSAKTIQSRIKAFTELKQGLKEAWGAENAYADVSMAIYEYEDEALADGKSQREAEKIALNNVILDLLQQPQVIFSKTRQLAGVN